jgi:hypothetical protein
MQVVVMAVLAFSAVLGLWATGVLFGAEFDPGRFLLGGVVLRVRLRHRRPSRPWSRWPR